MKAIGIGRLVRDPELKEVNDTVVCEFSLATDEYRKVNGERKQFTSFLDCVIWDKAAEVLVKYRKKGDPLYVETTVRQHKWEKDGQKKSRIVFRVDNFTLLSRGKPPTEDESESKPESEPETATPF
jgi:single-strand DNA-binding protein